MLPRFLCLLFLFHSALTISIDSDDEFDLAVFNETLIERFEQQVDKLQPTEYRRLVSRLGKIALFSRLIRRFPNPGGQVDFEHFFPHGVPFNRKLYFQCTSDILKCANFIFENLQSRASFLFPIKGQYMGDFKINQENFNRMYTNSLFPFDVTITYLFCFLTKNQFNVLQQLPYCSYGTANGTKQTWPADRYKELDQRSELYIDFGKEVEPIDQLTDQAAFQCAEQSFCPNPCCGHQSDTCECSHPVCRNATAEMNCSLSNDLNSNLRGMVANQWNVTCKCDSPGQVFRFDVERCVDLDECVDGDGEEHCLEGERQECVNTLGSFLCQCQMGFVRDADKCVPL